MKSLLLPLFLLFSVSAQANYIEKTFSRSFYGESEEEVVSAAQEAIPSILNIESRDLRYELVRANCFPLKRSYMSVKSLRVSKSYKPDRSGELKLVYRGRLVFAHSSCFER